MNPHPALSHRERERRELLPDGEARTGHAPSGTGETNDSSPKNRREDTDPLLNGGGSGPEPENSPLSLWERVRVRVYSVARLLSLPGF